MTTDELEATCKRTIEFWTPDSPTYQSAAAILELFAEVRALREENAICREAIEDAVDMVDACAREYDDDTSQGALRATDRKLSEAIGRACPRLLYEKPGGQKLYGLRWRELREENEALRKDKERLDSGRIMLSGWDDFGDRYKIDSRGNDLRQMIDEAMALGAKDQS